MSVVDHVFICCDEGAPEAQALLDVGLVEGEPNTHPGQGTACRRFFFGTGYLELMWVHDESQARSPLVRPTRLWDRWSARRTGASPFAVVLRPRDDAATGDPPFPFAPYKAPYLPDGMAIDYAIDTPLEEPGLFNLGFVRGGRPPSPTKPAHRVPLGTLTHVTVSTPAAARSEALRTVVASGLLDVLDGAHHLALQFDGGQRGESVSLPALRLALAW